MRETEIIHYVYTNYGSHLQTYTHGILKIDTCFYCELERDGPKKEYCWINSPKDFIDDKTE